MIYISLKAEDDGQVLCIYGQFLFHFSSFIKHGACLSLGHEKTKQLKVCCLCMVSRKVTQIQSQGDFETRQGS